MVSSSESLFYQLLSAFFLIGFWQIDESKLLGIIRSWKKKGRIPGKGKKLALITLVRRIK